MSFRNPNASQGSDEFHGLKEPIPEVEFNPEAAGGDDKKDKRKETKKFLFKKDSKEKGYSSLQTDPSQESIFLVNPKTSKKSKPDTKIATLNVFKKSFKDEKRLKDVKETKEEIKRSKKSKERSGESEHLFGNYIENAVRSFGSNDGVKMPAPIRICLDLIEQKGIESEHLYRRSVNKSQLESICESINNDKIEQRLDEMSADPNLACGVIKRFVRELKAPLVSDEILSALEKCETNVADKDVSAKVDYLKKTIGKMPQPNFDTFSYLIMHFHRVLSKYEINKIEIGIFVQKYQPYFRIKERVFKFLITYADLIFSDLRFKKYRVKTADEAVSRFSLLPDNIEELEQEIAKQELYLSKLHSKIANEEHSSDKTMQEQLCEELWALQRYVTSLKRKLKKLKLEHKNLEAEQLKNVKEATQQSQSNNQVAVQAKPNLPTKTETTASNEKPAEATVADPKKASSDEQPAKPAPQSPSQNEEAPQTFAIDPQILNTKDIYLTSENAVLTETLVQLLQKVNREKTLINELQQIVGNQNLMFPIPDLSLLSAPELIEREQLMINENKLLEERINLINKRIQNEKEKIFELKLSIQLKTIPNLSGEKIEELLAHKNTLDIHVSGKVNFVEKELVMTKL